MLSCPVSIPVKFRCPNCTHAIELVNDLLETEVPCPSCGSIVSLIDTADETISYRADDLGLEHFRLQEVLGQGEFGTVWKALDVTLNRPVAIKIPHQNRIDRQQAELFLREARMAASLRHPGIVKVHEVGRADHHYYIVSDYVPGMTLREWIREGRLTAETSARTARDVARAVQHAHEQNVIHRDLKPSNILLDKDGCSFVADFGLAKQEGGEATIAADGQILGTIAYMPPEQALGRSHEADARSDVYSIGVVLYEMLSGERPFQAKSQRTLLESVRFDDPRSLRKAAPGVPRELESICLKAMAKEPARRYQSAAELADDLQRYLDGKPVLARPQSIFSKWGRSARRNPAICSAVTAILLLVGLAGYLIFANPRDTSFKQTVVVQTDPANAHVTFYRIHPASGRPIPETGMETTGGKPVRLPPGDFLLVAYLDDMRWFHEVFRRVPTADELPGLYDHLNWEHREGAIELKRVSLHNSFELAAVKREGVTLAMVTADLAGHREMIIPSFYIADRELNSADCRGQKLPNTVQIADGQLTGLNWDHAVQLAERLGYRLPQDEEMEQLLQQPSPQIRNLEPPTLEWTSSRFAGRNPLPNLRVLRGAGPQRVVRSQTDYKDIGIRLARSPRPRISANDFVRPPAKLVGKTASVDEEAGATQ